MRLSELRPGTVARIVGIASEDPSRTRRLLEMGFLEGSPVEILHECPIGKDPFAVRVRGGLIALRRADASVVEIEEIPHE
jgi:Fe2+ transport system protein FeoA